MRMISVCLVEDIEEIRTTLAEIINGTDEYVCPASFGDVKSSLLSIPELKPDVILMDINLPDGSGIECVRKLKPLIPNTQFVMLTMYDDSNLVFEALAAGATGYLLKRTPPDKILEAIKEVYQGGSPMTMQIARMVVKYFSKDNSKKPVNENLTDREWEILGLLSKGMRYKEIAEKLFISIETVRTHLRKIYEKLQVRSATEAVLKYLSNK